MSNTPQIKDFSQFAWTIKADGSSRYRAMKEAASKRGEAERIVQLRNVERAICAETNARLCYVSDDVYINSLKMIRDELYWQLNGLREGDDHCVVCQNKPTDGEMRRIYWPLEVYDHAGWLCVRCATVYAYWAYDDEPVDELQAELMQRMDRVFHPSQQHNVNSDVDCRGPQEPWLDWDRLPASGGDEWSGEPDDNGRQDYGAARGYVLGAPQEPDPIGMEEMDPHDLGIVEDQCEEQGPDCFS